MLLFVASAALLAGQLIQRTFAEKWGLNDRRVTMRLGSSPALALKPLIEDIDAPDQLPLQSGWSPHSDGIIGLDVLRMYAIGIDTNGGKVSFWYGGKLSQPEVEQWANASLEDGAKMDLFSTGVEDWYHIRAEVNKHPVDMLLDTGTAYSTVNPSLEKPLGLKVIGETPVMEIGHSEKLKVATADSITFGPFAAEFPVLNIENQEDSQVEGILGTEALGTGKFLLDLPENAFYMWRQPAQQSNPLERRLRAAGIDLFPTISGALVTIVRAGSQAAEAGIASGDQLKSIGDVTVSDMVAGLQKPLDSKRMSRMLKVGLDAFGGELNVTVQRADGKVVTLALPK
jgi:hypothetical protein